MVKKILFEYVLKDNPTRLELEDSLFLLNSLLEKIKTINISTLSNLKAYDLGRGIGIQIAPPEKLINQFIFIKPLNKIYNFPEKKIIKIDFRKELNELIDEEIILHFIDYKNSSNNKKIFGMLKRGSLPDIYLLQFDPIRQGLYATEEERLELQRRSPVSDYDYNEEHAVDQLNMYFEKDVYTYEIEFHSSSVINVKLSKLNLRNEYTKGEVTIFDKLENLIMREIL